MPVIYMDNNATTRVDDHVMEAMAPFFTELYGNASSMHTFGDLAKKPVERAREQVAALLGCQAGEVVFTGCATESNNQAIFGAISLAPSGRRRIITSKVEHPAVLAPFDELDRRKQAEAVFITVDGQGRFNMAEYDAALTDQTALVSVMWANNETGVLFPIAEIAEKAKARGALVHCDAVQAVGKIPIDLSKIPIDLLSLSGHKLHAPKGVGALFVRRGLKLPPLLLGGGQESGRRGGTLNVPFIVGLGQACEEAGRSMDEENTRVLAMRDRLEARLLADCPDARLNGVADSRLPNTTNISFEYVEGESILLMLDRFGICASSGSACSSGSLNPSHVLRAMDVPFTAAHGSIRFSLSRFNTDEEVDMVCRETPPIIRRLREISPFGREKAPAGR